MHPNRARSVPGILKYGGSHAADEPVLHADIEFGLQLILAGHVRSFTVCLLPGIEQGPFVKRIDRDVQSLWIADRLYAAE